MNKQNIAGVSLRGGRKDKFFLTLLEYYPSEGRWFLRSMLSVKDEDGLDGNEAISSWIIKYNVKLLAVDLPASLAPCQNCTFVCPGVMNCLDPKVQVVQEISKTLLKEDQEVRERSPKNYEYERVTSLAFDWTKDLFAKDAKHHLLTRSFKRRLKKGFLPYWNRSIDFWVWLHYYDQLLDLFKSSYDSYHNISIGLLNRFSYLKRHLPLELQVYEGNTLITLIELLRANKIEQRDLKEFCLLEESRAARKRIILAIEKEFNIFMYDADLELLEKNPRAFDSFILAFTALLKEENLTVTLPDWAQEKMIIPAF